MKCRSRLLIILGLLFLICLINQSAVSQTNPDWFAVISDPGSARHVLAASVVDAAGNTYLTGARYSSGSDIFLSKILDDGSLGWTKYYDNPAKTDDFATSIAIAPDGHVVIAGYNWGEDSTRWDCLLLKYSVDGALLWSVLERSEDPLDDQGIRLAFDASGNIHVAQQSRGRGNGADFRVAKFSPTGARLWSAQFDGAYQGNDETVDMLVDAVGNSYVAGRSERDSTGFDFLLVKLDGAGNQKWSMSFDGAGKGNDEPVALKFDTGGNLILIGRSENVASGIDYLTLKCDTAGKILWSKYLGGAGRDEPTALACDASGAIVVTGRSESAATGFDFLTVKYTSSGDTVWTRRAQGSGTDKDFHPPVFAGIISAYSDHPGTVRLDWASAVDDQTRKEEIVYDIYQASASNAFRFTSPTYTTDAGATTFLATKLSPDSAYSFTVRARDDAGNADTGTIRRTVKPIVQRYLAGLPSDTALSRIPDIPFPPMHREDNVSFGGITVSRTQLGIVLKSSATVQEVNDLLRKINATIIGGIPDAGLLLIAIPRADDLQTLDRAHDDLLASPFVQAAATNFTGESATLPQPTEQVSWRWDVGTPPLHGNYAFELARLPQAWNLRTKALRHHANGVRSDLGIIDADIVNAHADFPAGFVLDPGPIPRPMNAIPSFHGTGVLGVAAAAWGNGIAVDGANPVPDQVRALPASLVNGWMQMLNDIRFLLLRNRSLHVINLSWQTPWLQRFVPPVLPMRDIVPQTTKTWADWMDHEGETWWFTMQLFNTNVRSDYLIVGAAGNQSNHTGGAANLDHNARYNAPFNNAAIRYGGNFISVEALVLSPNAQLASYSERDYEKSGSSISAGGTNILTLTNAGCTTTSGTSFAAPLVSGTLSYLWKLADPLGHGALKDILMKSTVPVSAGPGDSPPAAAPMLDAFDAVLRIDAWKNTNYIQHALVDVDDGTLDGNQRTRKDNDNSILSIYAGVNTNKIPDGMRGDSSITMADFRAFRDALVSANRLPNELDGGGLHPKRDLNEDGCVSGLSVDGGGVSCANSPAEEIFPRYDFNGDGRVDFSVVGDTSRWPPFKGRFLTDLEVLLDLWPDDPELNEGWSKERVIELLPSPLGVGGSGDLELRAHDLFKLPEVAAVEVYHTGLPAADVPRKITAGSGPLAPFADMMPYLVSTVKVSAGAIRMAGNIKDVGGTILSDAAPTIASTEPPWAALRSGEDHVVNIEPCIFPPDLRPTFSGGTDVSFIANAKDRDIVPQSPKGVETGISKYEWKFGDGGTSADENPTHKYKYPGQYKVTLTSTDNDPAEWGGTKQSTGFVTIFKQLDAVGIAMNSPDSLGNSLPLSGCVTFNPQGGNVWGPAFKYALKSRLASSVYGVNDVYLTYSGIALPNNYWGLPATVSDAGQGKDSVNFSIAKEGGYALFVTVSDVSKTKILGSAAITVNAGICGASTLFTWPSFRVHPSTLKAVLKSGNSVNVQYTPTVEELGGSAALPSTWNVDWDTHFSDAPADGGNGDGLLDSSDFNAEFNTDSGDRSIVETYSTIGARHIMARFTNGQWSGSYAYAGTTVLVDNPGLSAQITDVSVDVSGTRLEPEYTIRFTGEGKDSEGKALTYQWKVYAATPGYVIPDPPDGASSSVVLDRSDSYTILLTVRNTTGETATAQAVRSVMRTQIP